MTAHHFLASCNRLDFNVNHYPKRRRDAVSNGHAPLFLSMSLPKNDAKMRQPYCTCDAVPHPAHVVVIDK